VVTIPRRDVLAREATGAVVCPDILFVEAPLISPRILTQLFPQRSHVTRLQSSKKTDAAEKFISWATSKAYGDLVASKEGWANVPPGTRTSLYKNPEYLKAASFAAKTLESMDSADPQHPTVKPVPYVGVQFAAIPEFQGIATDVGQDFSAALAGTMTVDAALAAAQSSSESAMKKAGYIK